MQGRKQDSSGKSHMGGHKQQAQARQPKQAQQSGMGSKEQQGSSGRQTRQPQQSAGMTRQQGGATGERSSSPRGSSRTPKSE